MDAQVAEAFSSGHDRVFLAGDAAHCFPPAGGFGEIWLYVEESTLLYWNGGLSRLR